MFVYWGYFLVVLLICGAVLLLYLPYLDVLGITLLQHAGALLLVLVPIAIILFSGALAFMVLTARPSYLRACRAWKRRRAVPR
jgi:hypothetical protein